MEIEPYLAMTPSEISAASSLPPHTAWMACHFSPENAGLCNLPESIPQSSMLILNDRIPIHGHDPVLVSQMLEKAAQRCQCSCILLDLQRPKDPESEALIKHLLRETGLPMAVTPEYARKEHPVFLPPIPPNTPAETILGRYHGQEIWLDISPSAYQIELTVKGSQEHALQNTDDVTLRFHDSTLHCHYDIMDTEDAVIFRLIRTKEDIRSLLRDAAKMGVTRAVGLHQELWDL